MKYINGHLKLHNDVKDYKMSQNDSKETENNYKAN